MKSSEYFTAAEVTFDWITLVLWRVLQSSQLKHGPILKLFWRWGTTEWNIIYLNWPPWSNLRPSLNLCLFSCLLLCSKSLTISMQCADGSRAKHPLKTTSTDSLSHFLEEPVCTMIFVTVNSPGLLFPNISGFGYTSCCSAGIFRHSPVEVID